VRESQPNVTGLIEPTVASPGIAAGDGGEEAIAQSPQASVIIEAPAAFGFASRDSAPAGEIASLPAATPPHRRNRVVIGVGAAVLAATLVLAVGVMRDDASSTSTASAAGSRPVTAAKASGATDTASAAGEGAAAELPTGTNATPESADTAVEAIATRAAPAAAAPESMVAPSGDEDGEDSADGPSGTPLAGEGPCRIDVASTPAGSMVVLDGAVIAPSPITLATTCERHKVDIKHPRYKLLTKQVSPTETEPSKIEVTLQRPTHTVSFVTQPAGATVFIDGRRAGTTPTTVNILGFSNLKIEIKKPGYATAATRLYSKVAQDRFTLRMTKW
jgi:hypothetical protein